MQPDLEKPSLNCQNCNAELPESAAYCANCGQKVISRRVTLWFLLQEFWDAVFSIDSKIFRTTFALFLPGKLTKAYFSGKHGRYVPPIRLFFLSLVAFLFVVGLFVDQEDISLTDLSPQYEQGWNFRQALYFLDSAALDTRDLLPPESYSQITLDTLRYQFERRLPMQEDSLDLNEFFLELGDDGLRVALRDLKELPADTIIQRYQVEGFWNQVVQKQKIRYLQKGEDFISALIGKTTWTILFMMPFLALLLKILYIRRSFYYVEHLVFSFHIHTFIFFLSGILLLIKNIPEWLALAYLIVVPVYLFAGMKRFYGQGIFKTFFKLIVLSLLYSILSLLFLILTLVVTFFLF